MQVRLAAVGRFMLAAAVLALVVAVTLIAGRYARAHGAASWIMEEGFKDPATGDDCCGPEDCKPLPDDAVRIVPGGYFIVPTGETIPEARALPSKDGRYWRCTVSYADGGKTRCFFRAPPGS